MNSPTYRIKPLVWRPWGDALREELSRLKDAVWPGLPKFVSTPEKPQEDFYILVAEVLRAIFESHREPEGEPNEQAQNRSRR